MTIGLSQAEKDENAVATERGGRLASERLAPQLRKAMKLTEVFAGLEAQVPASAAELDVRSVACDSRKVQPRALFFALHGAKADGNAFIRDAVSRGAAAIASEDAPPATMPASVAWIQVLKAREALAITAANFFGQPATALQLVAV